MLIFLETERLVLRQFNPHDADLLVELDGDPRVMRYITGGAATPREEIESEYLPAFLGYYPKYPGYGFWAAIEKSTGDFLGWFHYRPAPATRPTSRSWATGCAARRGGRATPPRVPVR
jgi:RimJ/RimL family protein N-acetyltransferase